jgi:hypothetical protein
VAPVALLVKVRLLPAQSDEGDAFAVTEAGATLTVTAAVVAVVEPHELVAVTVYIPALEAVTAKADGFCAVEE